jgi:Lrp/AsnC family transcriptional regulator, regulator for asnA, asnC and gidA
LQIILDSKLDKIDIAIINSLMQDGRKSFRQIAREIKVSTPTVEARFEKMKGIGIITNIQPIINIDKIESQMPAMLFLKSNHSDAMDIANKLSSIPEIKSIYLMTGQFNIVLRLILQQKPPEYLEEFVRKKISTIEGIRSISYELITNTIKENPRISIKEGSFIKMKCEYCENDIIANARVLETGPFKTYFCCSSCLTLYKQKHKGRIEAIEPTTK